MASSVGFSSGTQYVSFGTGAVLSTLVNASVSLYFKVLGASGGNGGALYCERAATGNDIWKFQTQTGTGNLGYTFTHRDDAGTLNQINVTCTLNDGNWHHGVFTKAGTAIVFYLDGNQVGTGTLTGTNTYTNTGLTPTIGGDFGDANAAFTGRIDEVLLFNTTLAPTDVSNLYTVNTLPSGLIHTYHLDEGTGTTTADTTGTLNGTLATGVAWSTDVPSLTHAALGHNALMLMGVG